MRKPHRSPSDLWSLMSSLDWTPEGEILPEFCSASDLTPRSAPKGKENREQP